MPEVLTRQIPVTRLQGFCLFGYITAVFVLFRHDLNPEHLATIKYAMGWVEWPLDFTESSDWPTLWRTVPLHIEHFEALGDTSWSASLDRWGDDEWLLPRPRVPEVAGALLTWLDAVGALLDHRRWLPGGSVGIGKDAALQVAIWMRSRGRGLNILVLGHHLGSSMEPFSMLQEALRVGVGGGFQIEAHFCGQRHPKPGLVCTEFGYCDQSTELEQWFKKFESRWLGEYEWMANHWAEAQSSLAAIVGAESFMMEADVVVCGGPAWFCLMLRNVRPSPMLMYFAWPIAPLVPSNVKPHVFAQVQAVARGSVPPLVVVTANWILAAQFAAQVHVGVAVQRPHGLYVNRSYSPIPSYDGRPRVMVTRIGQWAKQSGVALLEMVWLFIESDQRETRQRFPVDLVFLSIRIRGANTNRPLQYAEFASFHACVFWPWDVMMLLFNELYTMTMPLLVPERRWMHHVMLHALSHTDVNWWHLRAENVAGALPLASSEDFPLPFRPWISRNGSLAEAAYWYELTDFMQFPHVTYFGSIPDLLAKVTALDVPRIREGMGAFNRRTLRDSLIFYRRAAAELLS